MLSASVPVLRRSGLVQGDAFRRTLPDCCGSVSYITVAAAVAELLGAARNTDRSGGPRSPLGAVGCIQYVLLISL